MFKFTFILLALGIMSTKATPFNKISTAGEGITEVTYLLTIEGKSYFYETTSRNWTATGEYCNSLGLSLATITSARQYEALNASYNGNNFAGYFWTDGRDALALRQFSWNKTEEAVPTDLHFLPEWDFQSCLYFMSVYGNSYLTAAPCSEDSGYTLCETNVKC